MSWKDVQGLSIAWPRMAKLHGLVGNGPITCTHIFVSMYTVYWLAGWDTVQLLAARIICLFMVI